MDASKRHIDELKERGWNELSHILDRDMPDNKYRVMFFRVSAAVLLLFLISVWGYVGLRDNSYDTGIISQKMIDNGQVEIPLNNNGLEENIDKSKRTSANKSTEGSSKSNAEIISRSNYIPSAQKVVKDSDGEVTILKQAEHRAVLDHKIDNVEITSPEHKKATVANLIPIKYSPLNSGKVNLSLKVNKYNDSTRIWPNTRIKPSLFAGTVWVPTRGIGFFNLGGGFTYRVGDWSIGTGIAFSKFLSRDINERQLVNLIQYDNTKNVVNNLHENQMDLNAQFSGEFNRSSYTQLQTQWGYVIPIDISWNPGRNLIYSVKGGMYFLRSKQRVIYTMSLLSEGNYVTKTEQMPYLGIGVDYRLGESYSIGLESMVLDPFTDDHFLGIGAHLSYQF